MTRREFLGLTAAGATTLMSPSTSAAESGLPNIVYVVLDTVRADYVDFTKGGAHSPTPVLADLAKQGIVFNNAWSTHDWTVPSHFSLFSGLHDGHWGKYDSVQNSLSHYLRGLGYTLIGVAANGTLTPKSQSYLSNFHCYSNLANDSLKNLDRYVGRIRRRIDYYNVPSLYRIGKSIAIEATYVVDRLEQCLNDYKYGPYFIFLNFMDAHDPYIPPREFYDVSKEPFVFNFFTDIRSRQVRGWEKVVKDDARRAELYKKLKNASAYKWSMSVDMTEAHLEIYRNRYQACVTSLDSELNRLMSTLKAYGIYDNSIIVITSDHGESFGEDDYLLHGLNNMGDPVATRKVPLLVLPEKKGVDGPVIVDKMRTIADIPFTILDLLGFQGLQSIEAQGLDVEYGSSFKNDMKGYVVHRNLQKRYAFKEAPAHEIHENETVRLQALHEKMKAMGYLE